MLHCALRNFIDLLSLPSAFAPKSFGWLSAKHLQYQECRNPAGLRLSALKLQWMTMAPRVGSPNSFICQKLGSDWKSGVKPCYLAEALRCRAWSVQSELSARHSESCEDMRMCKHKNGKMPVVSWFHLFPMIPMSLCGAQHAQNVRTHKNPHVILSSHLMSMMLLRGSALLEFWTDQSTRRQCNYWNKQQ